MGDEPLALAGGHRVGGGEAGHEEHEEHEADEGKGAHGHGATLALRLCRVNGNGTEPARRVTAGRPAVTGLAGARVFVRSPAAPGRRYTMAGTP